jgi:bla regulator protein blaR1
MMSSSPLHSLVTATLLSSLAIVIVGVLRKPLRYLAGARAAYWQWLLVPASVLAVLVPAPVHSVRVLAESLPHSVGAAYSAVWVSVNAAGASNQAQAVLVIWLLGAFAMLMWLARRQVAFVRSLGKLTRDPDGIYRSDSIVAPLLLGAWRPRIVVPADFEAHYSAEERVLVLAHERAHLVRGDGVINVLATVGLCLAWFNPLVYWALGRLRFDQELACDALVVAEAKTQRRLYADALLKTQLANDSAWNLAGCHWQSTHPLKERIAMLRLPSPGLTRRLFGIALTGACSLAGGYTAWAIQTELPTTSDPSKVIAIHLKWWVSGKDVLQVSGPIATQDIRVPSGNEFVEKVSFGPGQSFETRCFASLSNQDRESSVWETAKASGQSIEGRILFECKLSTNEKLFSTPAILVGDGKIGTIETSNPEGNVQYKLEFTASRQAARKAAAR